MVKRLKLSAYAVALAAIGLLATGCTLGNWTALDSWPRIITAILREDILG
jgi:hypothetical protein